MTFYAKGEPGKQPVFSGRPSQLTGKEVLLAIDAIPDHVVLISLDGKSLIDAPKSAALAWTEVRGHRNQLLDSSRWTVANDSPLSADCQSKWLDYLKALNRITVDYGDPTKVVWPVQPALDYD